MLKMFFQRYNARGNPPVYENVFQSMQVTFFNEAFAHSPNHGCQIVCFPKDSSVEYEFWPIMIRILLFNQKLIESCD